MLEFIVLVAFGAAVGAAAAALWGAGRRKQAEARAAQLPVLEKQVDELREQQRAAGERAAAAEARANRIPELEARVRQLTADKTQAELAAVKANEALAAARKSHAEKEQTLRAMGEEIKNKFAALAGEALDKNSETFRRLAEAQFKEHKGKAESELAAREKAIETLVKPLGENLKKLEGGVQAMEVERKGAYEALKEQVAGLMRGQTTLSKETDRLATALRQPHARGNWGEQQLRKVLELAGMKAGVDFNEQVTVVGDDGKLRPDAVLQLPGDKQIVIDAKTPLDAYLDAAGADDEAQRTAHLRRHTRQFTEHVDKLAGKEYWKQFDNAPDFVVMFIPGESFVAEAFEKDPHLWERAIERRVIISTPTTLIALAKAVMYGWRQQTQTENVQEVMTAARELYERLRVFAGHLTDVGKELGGAVDKYNKGIGSLEARVLPSARRLEQLGAAPAGAELPEVAPVEAVPRRIMAPELAGEAGAAEKA